MPVNTDMTNVYAAFTGVCNCVSVRSCVQVVSVKSVVLTCLHSIHFMHRSMLCCVLFVLMHAATHSHFMAIIQCVCLQLICLLCLQCFDADGWVEGMGIQTVKKL